MKSFIPIVSALILTASAQTSSPVATSTINITPGCPSAPAADVIVTRSAVAVPSCAGNETKPSIVSMSGSMATSMTMGSGSGMGSATGSGSPAQFTGAAARHEYGVGMGLVIGGAIAGLVL